MKKSAKAQESAQLIFKKKTAVVPAFIQFRLEFGGDRNTPLPPKAYNRYIP
jgi:hypothetical protein